MSALAPRAALALAVRLLEARGFAVSARNERGDSVYLRVGEIGGEAGPAIRVSNHARTAKQRRKHPEVATSLIIGTSTTSAQVAAQVEAAVRMFAARAAAPL